MRIEWAASATKHGISRESSGYVVAHSRTFIKQPAPPNSPAGFNRPRQVYLGDDESGTALEVMAIEKDDGTLLVIHAMQLREQYRKWYQEMKKWQST